ncbi:MAG: glycosyltransferase family 4 protein [Alphaproteobacteria bacterium]|nr:glycosyltransferase family 4 protein [Alphaproteobacteria bacterium]
MKLLIVSSTYMIAFNQRKWVQMVAIDPDLQVVLVTPEYQLTSFGPRRRERHPAFDTRAVPELRSFFNRSHMSYTVDPFALAGLMRRYKPDRIHIEEDPYSVIGFETVLLARLYARQARISFFLWDNLAREPRGIKGWLKRILNRFGLGHADLVICGNRQAQVLLHEKKKFAKRSVVLPQLGLTDAEYAGGRNLQLRDELGVAPETVLIGYVGRMVPEKGVMTLLEAFACLGDRDSKLLLLGSGPMDVQIAAYCERHLPGRVIRIAAVPHEQVPAYMRALDLFVLPSLSTPAWVEQFGIVLAQAMLSGVPCVGSSSGAIPEVIGPGGAIFSEGDVAALADQLRRLVDSAGERMQLGKKARAYALARYTQEAVASAYLVAFKSNNPSFSN